MIFILESNIINMFKKWNYLYLILRICLEVLEAEFGYMDFGGKRMMFRSQEGFFLIKIEILGGIYEEFLKDIFFQVVRLVKLILG